MKALKETSPELLRLAMNTVLALAVIGPIGFLLSGVGAALTIIAASARIAGIALVFMGRMATVGLMQLAVSGVLGGWRMLAGAIIRGVGVALRFAFIASGVGAVVAALAAAGTFIYNNWTGITELFKGIGEGFMASLGPARPLAEAIADAMGKVWGWITDLTGPLDASREQWRQWGVKIGESIAWPLKKLGELYDLVTNNRVTSALGLSSGKSSSPRVAVDKVTRDAAPTAARKSVSATKPTRSATTSSPPSLSMPVDPAALQAEINKLKASAAAVPGAMRHAMSKAKAIVDAVDLTSSGVKIMQSLANGIRQAIPQVTAAMTAAAAEIKAHVPQSPAKKGPLRGLTGIGIMTEIARGMDARPMVEAMHRAAAATRRAANDNARFSVTRLQRRAAAGAMGVAAMAAPAAAGQVSIGDINVQVHVAATNASPEAIGQAVGRRVHNAVRETYSDGGI